MLLCIVFNCVVLINVLNLTWCFCLLFSTLETLMDFNTEEFNTEEFNATS